LRGEAGSVIWHPFTQHALRSGFPKAVRAEGAYIFTADGRRIIDAISSWWVITHGHRHPRIVAAIRAAAETLDQVPRNCSQWRRPASRMSFSPTAARPASKSR
jgi:adenosylmethionine-8-amino-7-oxononanoate aminotransferase